jgi:hypothetical protein
VSHELEDGSFRVSKECSLGNCYHTLRRERKIECIVQKRLNAMFYFSSECTEVLQVSHETSSLRTNRK